MSDPIAALHARGVVVAIRALGDGGPDGIHVAPGIVVLNSSRLPARLQLVAAHLLEHQVRGDPPHVDWNVEDAHHSA